MVLRLMEGEAVKMLATETTATIGLGVMVSISGAHGKKGVYRGTKRAGMIPTHQTLKLI